jgi:DsbC/DsbD-like thiol-disulfide interchange protein
MRCVQTAFAVAGMVMSFAGILFAQPPSADDLVTVKLLADSAAIEPGKPFRLGVLFTIEPGWHIYWTNPGDSGTPTRVEFKLPAGFKAGPVQYPVPTKFTQPGDLVAYGYANEVLLIATVTPAPDLKPGQTVSVAAACDFLVCEKVCLPGKAAPSLSLPVSKFEPANSDVFGAWLKQVPVDPESIGARTSAAFDAEARQLTLRVTWRRWAPVNPQWFPPADENMNFTMSNLASAENLTIVAVKCSPLAGKSIDANKTFESVLAYDAGNGLRAGIRVPFRLSPEPADANADNVQPKD